jgi:small subunit ribosomal protein S20
LPKPSRKGISASKRLRQSIAARDRNRSVKSRTRTVINKALVAVGNDAGSAEDAVRDAISALDKAAQKGVIHANAAARSKSRLLKRFNLGVATSVAAAAGAASEPAPEPESEKPAPRRRNPLARRSTEEKKPPTSRAAKEGGTTRAPRSTGRKPTAGR